MAIENIKISKSFKERTTKAIWSIVFFVFIYFILAIGGIALTIFCTYLGIQIILIRANWLLILVGLGVISIGFLVLFFLIKFIFKKFNNDYSNKFEIKRKDEPKLFSFIDEIVKEVGTNFPKKIFITSEVNASVFYDSNFWSMFLPIKKNLQIGLGLVNSVSENEFKAILAHEFGHFSQRTMKVGSYVYNVNQIIFNLLYDNESYGKVVEAWSNLHAILGFFASVAIKIIEGIQWILRKVYEIVNLNYMSLSREMEFHADEVAANVAGSKHLINSLLRLDLAENSYQSVLEFYNKKISESIKTSNIFPQQFKIMNFLANENEIPIKNNLPLVTIDFNSRFNKSKLVFENQWSSHPSTEDRVAKLNKLNISFENEISNSASDLFSNFKETEINITNEIFSQVEYSENPKILESDEFISQFKKEYDELQFNKLYNQYYNNKNPYLPNSEEKLIFEKFDFKKLFDNEKVDLVYSLIGLEQDIFTLENISKLQGNIKTFDYNGEKYLLDNIIELLPKLKTELEEIKMKIKNNDINIYNYFISLAIKQNIHVDFEKEYSNFLEFDGKYDSSFKLFSQLTTDLNFVYETTPLEKIKSNFEAILPIEKEYKAELNLILNSANYKDILDNDKLEKINKYLNNNESYFSNNEYNQESLALLNESLHLFQETVNKAYFTLKKALLENMANIHFANNQI